MAFYYSRRKLRVSEDAEGSELNIIPYLDILMNLIIFMLLSMTGLASFGIVNVTAPEYDNGTTAMTQPSQSPQQHLLSVGVSARGFYVAGAGAVLGQDSKVAPGSGAVAEPTIPVRPDGSFDFASLTSLMARIKADPAFAQQTQVLVGAEGNIKYETLVQTMDAVRETADKALLFTDVSLTAM
jgi:biopolymer transport protein TolR